MDLQRVQSRLQYMGKIIADILERNNIPYMITFGTLLGAVRHGGFIPWDDDFDIFLFDDTYQDAIMALGKELPGDLFLEYEKTEPLYFHNFAHVKDTKSIAICQHYPHDGLYAHKGLSIDLYRAVKLRECDLDRYLIQEHINYLNRRYRIKSIEQNSYENQISKLNQELLNLPVSNSTKPIFGMALAERCMNVEDVLPLKKIKFGDYEFYGPSNPDGILRSFYGDYMELPQREQRIPHYDDVKFL